ncbi:MAG: hypothetical protein OIF57_15500, partial [Marinobacterium sp.]|nr:hypothetical protein [Marinobacterium sp.]
MKFGLVIDGDIICDPVLDHTQISDIAARHGFALSAPFSVYIEITIAGRTLQLMPSIENRPAPPASIGYYGSLTTWQIDTENQCMVRTVEYHQLQFDDSLADARRHIDGLQNAALACIEHGYTSQEVKTWAQQQAEATEWVADNAAVVPLLQALAECRGVSIALVVEKIRAKASDAARLTGIVLGSAQAANDQIDSLQALNETDQLPDDW